MFKSSVKLSSISISSGGDHANDKIPAGSTVSLAHATIIADDDTALVDDRNFKLVGLVGSDGQFSKQFANGSKLTKGVRIKFVADSPYWVWIYHLAFDIFPLPDGIKNPYKSRKLITGE